LEAGGAPWRDQASEGWQELSLCSEGGRVSHSDWLRLQDLTGSAFTVEVCDSTGPVKAQRTPDLVPHCDAFLQLSSLRNAQVLLQLVPERAEEMVAHYRRLKAANPGSVGACILVLGRKGVRWRALVKGWQHIATLGDRRGSDHWHVWWDRPLPQLSMQTTMRHALTMQFDGQIAGMQAAVLADSGASDVYVGRAAVQRAGLKEIPCAEPYQVTLGDDSVATCSTMTVLPLRIKGYRGKVRAYVLPQVTEGFDVVLGDTWLTTVGAVLDYRRRAMCMRQGRQVLMLQPKTQPSAPATGVQGVSAHAPHKVLGAMQMKKELRRAGRRGDQAYLVVVRGADAAQQGAGLGPGEQGPGVDPHLMPESVVSRLTATYADVMVDELPSGLPPHEGLTHAIPIIPGAKPPSRPLYRMSPRELEEVKRQVTDLLSKGLIEPSTSPFGAPVLFVQKKDGSLRMCIDYRALNKITVRNQWPLPRIDELLDQLQGATCFSMGDLISGFHQCTLLEEDRPKTAFRTPMGLYQFKVLSMGLCNAPSTFAALMHRVLGDMVGNGVLVYLDDILVYSKTWEEHERILEEVLRRLRANRLFLKRSKVLLNQTEVTFLGHRVGRQGIQPDPAKVAAVKEFPRPKSVTDLRSFLGLANYFRRFIQGYATRVLPLQALLSGKALKHGWREESWGPDQEKAFEWVKQALTSAPVLAVPDLSKPFQVTIDASVEGIGAVLEQEGRPVAFESRKLTDAEVRYTTTEQEMLAVVHALRVWRCYLEGGQAFLVRTDHNPNTYFGTKPMLSRREARWSDFLAQFNFQWQYVPGKTNVVADALSRAPRGRLQITLRRPVLAAMTRARVERAKATQQGHGLAAGLEADAVLQEYRVKGALPVIDEQPPPQKKGRKPRQPQSAPLRSAALLERIKKGYDSDPDFKDPVALGKAGLKLINGLWWKGDQIAVPGFDAYKDAVLYEAHDAVSSGHMGVAKTLERVKALWWWPTLQKDVERYVRSCDSCQRMKGARTNKGLLHSLPVPGRAWESVSMDWMVSLPETSSGNSSILVVVDRLTKMVHLIPCKGSVTAPDTAKQFVQHVWRLHGLPTTIVSDRDRKFTGAFWQELCRLVGTQQRMSTAYHPQTDGQTERTNRTIEEVLRHYVGQSQTDWEELLPMAEYAINSSKHESTQETPFFLNYGQHPRSPVELAVQLARPERCPEAKGLVERIQAAVQKAKTCLRVAQERQKAYADKHRDGRWAPAVGHEVMLHTVNLDMQGCSKLLPKWLGPFKVTKVVNPVAFRLELPPSMSRLHPVFHLSLLKPYVRDPGRTAHRYTPLLVDRQGLVFKVDRILKHRDVVKGSRKTQAGKVHRKVREYLIKWEGFDESTWEPEGNIVGGAKALLSEYWAKTMSGPAKSGKRKRNA
jgi:hypothetical protein